MSVMSRLAVSATQWIDPAVRSFLRNLLLVNTVAATGTANTDAAALTAGKNAVTGADDIVGTILPNAELDMEVAVLNTVANKTLKVYPNAGGQINALTVTTGAFSVLPGAEATFYCDVAGSSAHWYVRAGTTPVLDMTGTTGLQEIRLTTNLADALSIEDTVSDFVVFASTTNAKAINVDKAVQFNLGASASVTGSGFTLNATRTVALGVYTDDGNAVIGSGTLTRAGRFRNLQTYTAGNREQEAVGAIGQLVSVAGTNRHNMAGLMGSYEASTSLVVDGQDPATDPWIQAGVIGRVGVGSGITTINANGILAGVAAMSNTTSFSVDSGSFSAFYVGKWAGTTNWDKGLHAEATAVAQFLFLNGGIVAGTSTAGTILQAGTLAAPVDINTASAFGIKVFTRSTSTAAHTNARFRGIGNAASGTPTIEGVLAQASVADSKFGGAVQGLVAAARIGSAATMGGSSSIITAARFKTEDARATDGTSTAPTYAGNVYGITVQGQISAAPTGDYVGIHFDCQTAAAATAQPWDAVFDFQPGGQNSSIVSLFNFAAAGGMLTTTASGGATRSHKILCKVNGADAYLSLYTD